MADYRELLRRAVEILPENNGAARRLVYEKARAALVAQLRAIDPPLAPREITQHRLQLEDCIREVEQQATEILLGSLKAQEANEIPISAPPSVPKVDEPAPAPAASPEIVEAFKKTPASEPVPVVKPEPEPEIIAVDESEATELADVPIGAGIEQVIEGAVDPEFGMEKHEEIQPVADFDEEDDEFPVHVPESLGPVSFNDEALTPEIEAEPIEVSVPEPEPEIAADSMTDRLDTLAEIPIVPEVPAPEPVPEYSAEIVHSPAFQNEGVQTGTNRQSKVGSIEFIIAQAQAAAARAAVPTRWKRDAVASDLAQDLDVLEEERPEDIGETVGEVEFAEELFVDLEQPGALTDVENAAMSSVREVEIEAVDSVENNRSADPQIAIDNAIQTLDREARGDQDGPADALAALSGSDAAEGVLHHHAGDKLPDDGERESGNAVMIFLLLVALLLVGVGGAGFWAWREGYIDLDSMFGQGESVEEVAVVTPATTNSGTSETIVEEAATGPGNTTATPEAVATVSEELGKSEERLTPENSLGTEAPATTPVVSTPAAIPSSDSTVPTGSQERLTPDQPVEATQGNTDVATAPAEAVVPLGSQSLLLEASSEGTTGAVPFSGTVDWSRGVDELGEPTLLAKANIPARNLGVELLIRRNSDPGLPASHLMEVNFIASETFVGGSIAGLPGVLLKNEELVQGTPLVGASARVVGNSFLFALSAADQDVAINTNLLRTRKWVDLALVYATGKRAIITLEKDATAQAMFDEVLTIWAASDAASSAGQTAGAAAN